MGPILIVVLFFLVLVGILVLTFRYAIKQNKKKTLIFTEFAKEHNLEYTFSKYMFATLNSVQGAYKGIHLNIYEKMVGSGKNRHVVTTATIANGNMTFDFSIGKEQFFSKTGKLLGFKDIEFGDAAFDKAFLLKSKSEDEFRSLMNYENQAKLTGIKDDLAGTIHCKDGMLSYSITGVLGYRKNREKFMNVLQFMIDLTNTRMR